MGNKSLINKNKRILLLTLLILALLCAFSIFSNQFVIQSNANEFNESITSFNAEHDDTNDYSLEEIRDILSSGGELYQNFREFSDTEGVKTHRVLVQGSDASF